MDRGTLKLYFICGTCDCPKGNFLEVLKSALAAGITCFQFREKGHSALKGEEKRALARQVKQLCSVYHVPLIIDDDVELALEIDADGIHLGQDDLAIKKARELFPDKILGLSVGTLEEYRKSDIDLVDYIGSGPVFPTISKSDADPAIGFEGLAKLRDVNPILPIVAIGGLKAQHVSEVMKAGADGVAIISAISRADDPGRATREFCKAFSVSV